LQTIISINISWRPGPFAQAMDAFPLNWKGLDGCAFSLFCLIGKYLQKIQQEQSPNKTAPSGFQTDKRYPQLRPQYYRYLPGLGSKEIATACP